MRSDYLIAGIILIALGFVQLWANGRWPFRPHRVEDDGAPGRTAGGVDAVADVTAGAPQPSVEADASPAGAEAAPPGEAVASGGLWRSWTNVAGYVAIALGIVAIVLAALRT